MTTIDHIEGIGLPSDSGGNELITLGCLRAGLGLLATHVSRLEEPFRQREAVASTQMVFFGNSPDLPPGAVALLPCFFHWFGVSACNYVRLVGFLRGLAQGAYDRAALEDPSKFSLIQTHCDDYVSSVSEIAPVKVWRDKVAAHFAITAPRKASDNVALLDFSVMYPVAYEAGRFRVNVLAYSRTDGAGSTHEARLPPWSVTEVFEQLSRRYWPTQAKASDSPIKGSSDDGAGSRA